MLRLSTFLVQFKKANPEFPAEQYRGHHFKDVNEAWQAAIFGLVYGAIHRLGTIEMRHNREQYSQSDATYRWTESGKQFVVPVQVKELPPNAVNPNESIDHILEKVALKYLTSHDLIVAIHLNRSEVHARDIRFKTPVAQLWLWGWSKPDHSEIHITGGGPGASRTFKLRFPPYPSMDKADVLEIKAQPAAVTTTIG
jgi:hypothetical protein